MATQANQDFLDYKRRRDILGNRNFRSHVISLPGVKVPLPGTFVPWNSRSQELSFPETFAPVSENEVELSLLTQRPLTLYA